MLTLERDTAGNPAFLTRLNAMHADEPSMREQIGITPAMTDYITRAFAETKLTIYQKYLSEEEYAYVRKHYFDRMQEWPALIARLQSALNDGIAPDSAHARQVAADWLALFRSYAGENPATQMKIRRAMEQEPTLSEGTWLTPPLLAYLREAVVNLNPAPSSRMTPITSVTLSIRGSIKKVRVDLNERFMFMWKNRI